MKVQFIGESIQPLGEDFDFSQSAPGEPAVPRKFRWRKETVEVEAILRKWKTNSPCTHGNDEQYVRKHWLELATKNHGRMHIYFDRTTTSSRKSKKRWWLYSVAGPARGYFVLCTFYFVMTDSLIGDSMTKWRGCDHVSCKNRFRRDAGPCCWPGQSCNTIQIGRAHV